MGQTQVQKITKELDEAEKVFMKNLIASGTKKEDAKLYASAYRAGMNIGIIIFANNKQIITISK